MENTEQLSEKTSANYAAGILIVENADGARIELDAHEAFQLLSFLYNRKGEIFADMHEIAEKPDWKEEEAEMVEETRDLSCLQDIVTLLQEKAEARGAVLDMAIVLPLGEDPKPEEGDDSFRDWDDETWAARNNPEKLGQILEQRAQAVAEQARKRRSEP